MPTTMKIQKKHQLTGHNAAIYTLVPGPGAGTFLSASGDGMIVQWSLDDPETGRLLAQVNTQVFSLAYLPATHTLVAGDMNGGVHWLNLHEDRPNKHLAHHRQGTYAVLAVDEHLFTLGGDGVLTRWDIAGQRSIESLQLSNQALRSISYAADRQELAIGSSDNSIFLLDVADFSIRQRLVGAHDNSVFSVLYHPYQPGFLLSGGRDAHLKVWDLAAPGTPVSSHPAHWFTLNQVIAHPEKDCFLTASRDKSVRIWTGSDYQLLQTLDAARDGGHINSVNRLLWIPGTNCFASASDDRSIMVWEWVEGA